MTTMPIVETERLQLHELDSGDAEFILRLLNEPAFHRNIGDRGLRSIDDARRYIDEGPCDSYRRLGFGLYRVSLRERLSPHERASLRGPVSPHEKGEPVGICGLIQRDFLAHPDIGFAFLETHWRKGYALESAAAVLVQARVLTKLTQVMAITAPDNTGSIRVLEKLGLRYQETVTLPGATGPTQIFAGPVAE